MYIHEREDFHEGNEGAETEKKKCPQEEFKLLGTRPAGAVEEVVVGSNHDIAQEVVEEKISEDKKTQ